MRLRKLPSSLSPAPSTSAAKHRRTVWLHTQSLHLLATMLSRPVPSFLLRVILSHAVQGTLCLPSPCLSGPAMLWPDGREPRAASGHMSTVIYSWEQPWALSPTTPGTCALCSRRGRSHRRSAPELDAFCELVASDTTCPYFLHGSTRGHLRAICSQSPCVPISSATHSPAWRGGPEPTPLSHQALSRCPGSACGRTHPAC